MESMTPKEIVIALDKFIVGQNDAKKAVAIALRNRWRRMNLDDDLRAEVTPKNILMIGPTGVGKTEIARRLATLANAPFIKIEATKFTEVGYIGKDVESIIRDLIDAAVKLLRENSKGKYTKEAKIIAQNRILDAILPKARTESSVGFANEPHKNDNKEESNTRKIFRKKLESGELDDKEINIEIVDKPATVTGYSAPGMGDLGNQIQDALSSISSKNKKPRKITVKKALKLLIDEESLNLINEEDINAQAVYEVEQKGIVFLDELDKICKSSDRSGDVSREGVQRDLLPLIEGCTVSTKYGMVKTDHILFIGSGAFHIAKPSDLLPELQGRLPIRVELKPLNVEDFVKILKDTQASLLKQYIALLATEKVTLDFKDDAILRIAEIAWQVNEDIENIGARRLHTVMETLLEDISFEATEKSGETLCIDCDYVNLKLELLMKNKDLSQYIL